MGISEKRILAAIMAWFGWGVFGLHWFYLNDTVKGKKYFWGTIISILLCVVFVGIFGVLYFSVNTIIDGYNFLTMTNEEFEEKYFRNTK